jgi:hypothetical protein
MGILYLPRVNEWTVPYAGTAKSECEPKRGHGQGSDDHHACLLSEKIEPLSPYQISFIFSSSAPTCVSFKLAVRFPCRPLCGGVVYSFDKINIKVKIGIAKGVAQMKNPSRFRWWIVLLAILLFSIFFPSERSPL